MTPAERAKARRDKRKASRLCANCEAGLQDEDNILCVECFDKRAEAQKAYDARNPRRKRARLTKPSPEVKARSARLKRQRYAQKALQGICVRDRCKSPRVSWARRCEKCIEVCRKASLKNYRTKFWPRTLGMNLWRASVEPHRQDGRLPKHMRFRTVWNQVIAPLRRAA